MENNKNNNTSKASSVWKSFCKYVHYIVTDFLTSFKYNKMKLAGYFVAIPGIFLGFFLVFHIPVVNGLSFTESRWEGADMITIEHFPDLSALVLFILVLFGVLNLFTAFNMIAKKNLGSVVTATITAVVIVLAGALYLVMVFLYVSLVQNGNIKLPNNASFEWTSNYILSIGSVVISMICSVVGVVLGFINYDRNYKKVTF